MNKCPGVLSLYLVLGTNQIRINLSIDFIFLKSIRKIFFSFFGIWINNKYDTITDICWHMFIKLGGKNRLHFSHFPESLDFLLCIVSWKWKKVEYTVFIAYYRILAHYTLGSYYVLTARLFYKTFLNKHSKYQHE